jgi:AbiV family abortive infection protein
VSVSVNVLLKGAWYALEQSGHLLHDAVKLHSARSFATAMALALLAREELGRYRILLELWQRTTKGEVFSAEDVRAAYRDHGVKQRRALLSMTYRTEGSTTELAELLRARIKTRPGTPEFRTVAEKLKQLDKRMRKRTPADRHAMRMSATYVDINDDGTDWNRPVAFSETEATNCLMDAVNDYALQLDQVEWTLGSAFADALAAWPHRPPLPPPVWPVPDAN